MKKVIQALLIVLTLNVTLSAQTQNDELKRSLQIIIEQLQGVLAKLNIVTPPEMVIQSGEEAKFQQALNDGGTINIAAGVKLSAARFTASKSGTTIIGQGSGALLNGESGPALHIMPGTSKIRLVNVEASSNFGNVVQCGNNDGTQTLYAQQPSEIELENVRIPHHRGKRGVEVNCGIRISGLITDDIYSGETNPQDSQAVNILNTCGPVVITKSKLVAGSENLLLGGDTLKITDCPERVVYDVLIEDNDIQKPEAWFTANTRVAPKNVVELKAGKKIVIRNNRIGGSYVGKTGSGATQDGSCIVITPKNAQYIQDVLVENNTISRCGGGVQLMGKDYNSVTPQTTTGVVFRGNTWTIDHRTYGGRGVLALVVGGMQAVLWENEQVVHTGTALFSVDSTTPTGPFTMRGVMATTGTLVCAAPGVNYCGLPAVGSSYAVRPFTVNAENNTFADAPSQFKKLYPNNTFVTRADLDKLLTGK